MIKRHYPIVSNQAGEELVQGPLLSRRIFQLKAVDLLGDLASFSYEGLRIRES